MCSGSVGFKKTTLLNICAQWNPAKKSMRTCLLYPISVRCKHIVMRRCVEHADMANTKIQGLKLWTNMWIIDLSMSACKFRQHDWKDEKLRLFFLYLKAFDVIPQSYTTSSTMKHGYPMSPMPSKPKSAVHCYNLSFPHIQAKTLEVQEQMLDAIMPPWPENNVLNLLFLGFSTLFSRRWTFCLGAFYWTCVVIAT